MTTPSTEGLKPCAHCGEKPWLRDFAGWEVHCSCGITFCIESPNQDDVVTAWNRRPAQASEAAIRNAALEEAAADVLTMHDADISARGQHYAKGSVKDKAWKNLRSALQSTTPAEPVAKVPEGYVLVPIEPTGIMKDSGAGVLPLGCGNAWTAGDVYRAMLAASPIQSMKDE